MSFNTEDQEIALFLFAIHSALNEGHMLILPKKHCHDVDDLDEIIANEIIKASAMLSRVLKAQFQPDGITVIQKGGLCSNV